MNDDGGTGDDGGTVTVMSISEVLPPAASRIVDTTPIDTISVCDALRSGGYLTD